MTHPLLCQLLVLLVSSSLVESSSELFCHCHVAHHKHTDIAIHCANKQAGSTGITCDKASVTELPAGYRFVPPYGLYKVYRTFKPWQEARESCLQEGARLAVPTDENLLKGLTTLFSTEPGIWYAYIGVTDLQSNGFYLAADGKETPFLNWGPGEPNHNDPDEHCLTLDNKSFMNDYPCARVGPYICERKLQAPVPQDYRWIEDAGRFVAVRDKKMVYEEARQSCEKDGARLAVPDTWTRAQALLRLLDPSFKAYFVGFTDNKVEGDFVTDSGRHLKDMEFRPWGKGEPNNSGGGKPENCVALLGVGYYNDVRCDQEFLFICEIVPA